MQANFTKPKGYIGITGWMHSSEVRTILNVPLPAQRDLMIGVLSSNQKIMGGRAKFPARYPEPHEIKDIFVDHPRVVNLIHYTTNDRATLSNQLTKLIELGGPNLHGFQLNMAWPNPAHLESTAKRTNRIVLHLGEHAIRIGGSPQEISEKIKTYQGLISDVLLDPSGGKGQLIDVDYALKYLRHICPDHPNLGIGIAGGLSPETLAQIAPLLKEFPNLSTDVEGRVRDKTTDKLIIERAILHIESHQKIFFS